MPCLMIWRPCLAYILDLSRSFMGKSRGGKIFPEEFSKVLIIEFNNQVSTKFKSEQDSERSRKKASSGTRHGKNEREKTEKNRERTHRKGNHEC